jgi:hypothetical protein
LGYSQKGLIRAKVVKIIIFNGSLKVATSDHKLNKNRLASLKILIDDNKLVFTNYFGTFYTSRIIGFDDYYYVRKKF